MKLARPDDKVGRGFLMKHHFLTFVEVTKQSEG